MRTLPLLGLYLIACLLLAANAQPPLAYSFSLARASRPATGTAVSPDSAIYPDFTISLRQPAHERSEPFFAPILSADQATALAWLIVRGSVALNFGKESVQHLVTTAASYASINSHPMREQTGYGSAAGPLWMVKFCGQFTPKHLPPGIDPPIYTQLTVLVDMHGGGVIGFHMGGGD